MTTCEMCGKPATARALVESTEMDVCAGCARFGKPLSSFPRYAAPAKKAAPRPAGPAYGLVSDWSKRIRDARTKSGLTQKEFALKINEKESVLHHWETGTTEPDIETARKLERILHVTLVEETTPLPVTGAGKKQAGAGLTIGDVLRMR